MRLVKTVILKNNKEISLWRNDQGFIEGYLSSGEIKFKSKGADNRESMERIVSVETTSEGFMKFFRARGKKRPSATSRAKSDKQQTKLL